LPNPSFFALFIASTILLFTLFLLFALPNIFVVITPNLKCPASLIRIYISNSELLLLFDLITALISRPFLILAFLGSKPFSALPSSVF